MTDADFVVFVLDQSYGLQRKSSGRSGVHEEWNIATKRGIPNHVYLKRSDNASIKPEAIGPFIDLNAQELFHAFLSAAHAVFDYESKHVVAPGATGPVIELPGNAVQCTIYKPQRPLPQNFHQQRQKLKDEVRMAWDELGAVIRRRY